MKTQKLNLHGLTEEMFMLICSRNVVMKVKEEQDNLLLQYGDNIGGVILAYLQSTTKDNLEMIFNNEFEFNLSEVDNLGLKTFRMKFDYYH